MYKYHLGMATAALLTAKLILKFGVMLFTESGRLSVAQFFRPFCNSMLQPVFAGPYKLHEIYEAPNGSDGS